MAANAPHAYISGDILECMALSDNVAIHHTNIYLSKQRKFLALFLADATACSMPRP